MALALRETVWTLGADEVAEFCAKATVLHAINRESQKIFFIVCTIQPHANERTATFSIQ